MAITKAEKEGWQPKNKDNALLVPDQIIDLDGLNMQGLISQLEQSIHKPQSRWIFIKRRENTRLELDRDRVRLLLDTVSQLRATNEELIYLKAETFLSPQKVAFIIENKMTLLKEQFGFAIDEARLERKKLLYNDEILKSGLETLNIENLRRKAEINILSAQHSLIMAETDMKKAQAERERAAADMVRFIINNVKPDDLLPHHKSYIIQAIANPQGHQFQDLELLGEIKQIVVNREGALTKQEEHRAKDMEHKAEITGTQSQLEKIKIKKQYPEIVK